MADERDLAAEARSLRERIEARASEIVGINNWWSVQLEKHRPDLAKQRDEAERDLRALIQQREALKRAVEG